VSDSKGSCEAIAGTYGIDYFEILEDLLIGRGTTFNMQIFGD
jgi:hypothetical protein